MEVTAKGYAYSMKGPAIGFSLIVLAAYVGIAIVHVAVSVFTGITSSSWDTPGEIMVLALNSTPPRDQLKNTGAGISKISTLKLPTRIEALEGRLELSLHPDQLSPGRRIQPNQLYG